jgi:acyl-CoA synthetase (AMP-forming)/AMP-acid ligase II
LDFLSNTLIDKTNQSPDKEIFIFEYGDSGEERITYKMLYENSFKIASELKRIGVKAGDTFGIVMRNYPEFIYLLIAGSLIGAIAVPVDPRSKGQRLEYMLGFPEVKVVFVTEDLLHNILEVKPHLPLLKHIYILSKPGIQTLNPKDYPYLNEVIERKAVSIFEPVSSDPSHGQAMPFEIIFTSGTTGEPKGVVVKQDRFGSYALLAQMVWQYTESDVLYTGLSFTHGNAQAVTMVPALAMGIKAVISPQFTKSRIWDICRKYGVTTFSLLGGMMSGIYNEPRKPNDADNPVKIVISAGTPKAIWQAFEQRFNVLIHEWYGAVEGGFAHKPPGEGPIGSFGKPLEGLMEMKIFDEHDRECPPYVTGEIVWRMVGEAAEVNYLKNKKASEEKTRGGWLRTGDMGHTDENGYFFFDYRKGGGLRRQGEFVQPDYIEKVIGEHPDVSEVCVYGIPASSGAPGESDLVAAIVPFPDKKLAPDDIFELCKKALPKNLIPSYIQIVNEIPKTISEKPLDNVLRSSFNPSADNVYKIDHVI